MFQTFTGVGRLTKDPELKQVGEYEVTDFGVAINGFKDEVLFLNGKTWGKSAKSMAEYTHKGDKVLVEGELKQDDWEDKEGNKRSKIYLNAKRVVFLESKGEATSAAAPAAATTADIPF